MLRPSGPFTCGQTCLWLQISVQMGYLFLFINARILLVCHCKSVVYNHQSPETWEVCNWPQYPGFQTAESKAEKYRTACHMRMSRGNVNHMFQVGRPSSVFILYLLSLIYIPPPWFKSVIKTWLETFKHNSSNGTKNLDLFHNWISP